MLHHVQWGITARHVESLDLSVSCPRLPYFPLRPVTIPVPYIISLPPLVKGCSETCSCLVQMPSLQGPSQCSCRHRIKAWKITLLCPYGGSIGLGQWTLNCNSAIVEKVSWAPQSAQIDKLLALVIFQMQLSPRHVWSGEAHILLPQDIWLLYTAFSLCTSTAMTSRNWRQTHTTECDLYLLWP